MVLSPPSERPHLAVLPAPATGHSHLCLLQFNNMLLYCVPRVIQVGAQFQVRTRIDVAGMKVRGSTSKVGLSTGSNRRGQPGSQSENQTPAGPGQMWRWKSVGLELSPLGS